jgi:hypothetical protein
VQAQPSWSFVENSLHLAASLRGFIF